MLATFWHQHRWSQSNNLKSPREMNLQPYRVFPALVFEFQFSSLLSYFLIIIWIIYFKKIIIFYFKIMIDKIRQLRYYLKAIMSNGQTDQFYAFFESSLKTVGNRLSPPFTFWSSEWSLQKKYVKMVK